MMLKRSLQYWPLFVQGGLVCAILVVAALAPPARGAILIVSLNGQGRGEIARWAIGHRALLVGAGPWRNSLVVSGERGALFGAAMRNQALLIAASAAGCRQAPQA